MSKLERVKEKVQQFRDTWQDCYEYRNEEDEHFGSKVDALDAVLAVINEEIEND